MDCFITVPNPTPIPSVPYGSEMKNGSTWFTLRWSASKCLLCFNRHVFIWICSISLSMQIENLQEQLKDKEKQMSSLKERVKSLQADTSNTDTALTTLEEALAEKVGTRTQKHTLLDFRKLYYWEPHRYNSSLWEWYLLSILPLNFSCQLTLFDLKQEGVTSGVFFDMFIFISLCLATKSSLLFRCAVIILCSLLKEQFTPFSILSFWPPLPTIVGKIAL